MQTPKLGFSSSTWNHLLELSTPTIKVGSFFLPALVSPMQFDALLLSSHTLKLVISSSPILGEMGRGRQRGGKEKEDLLHLYCRKPIWTHIGQWTSLSQIAGPHWQPNLSPWSLTPQPSKLQIIPVFLCPLLRVCYGGPTHTSKPVKGTERRLEQPRP